MRRGAAEVVDEHGGLAVVPVEPEAVGRGDCCALPLVGLARVELARLAAPWRPVQQHHAWRLVDGPVWGGCVDQRGKAAVVAHEDAWEVSRQAAEPAGL